MEAEIFARRGKTTERVENNGDLENGIWTFYERTMEHLDGFDTANKSKWTLKSVKLSIFPIYCIFLFAFREIQLRVVQFYETGVHEGVSERYVLGLIVKRLPFASYLVVKVKHLFVLQTHESLSSIQRSSSIRGMD